MDDVVTSIYSALEQEKANSHSAIHNAIHFHVVSEDIVDLNDKAVACMLKNDFQSALENLQVALARIMALQAQPAPQHASFMLSSDQQSPIASIPLPTSSGRRPPHEDIFVVFHRALVIPHHCDFDLACTKNQSRALATVLYNIALVYHLLAMERGDSTIFGHALSYYGWAYYVVETAAQQYGFQDILLLLLALFNNMGSIHASHSMDGDKTRQCLRWMQSTFANPHIKQVLFPEDYQFFFQYISMQSHRQLQLAPAA